MSTILIPAGTPTEEIQAFIDASQPFDTLCFQGVYDLSKALHFKGEGRSYIGQGKTVFRPSLGRTAKTLIEIEDMREAMPRWARVLYALARWRKKERVFFIAFQQQPRAWGGAMRGISVEGN